METTGHSSTEDMMDVVEDEEGLLNDATWNPHAYHLNLPPQHVDPKDGVPYITKFVEEKARQVLKLAHSIQLTEELFVNSPEKSSTTTDEQDNNDEDDYGFPQDHNTIASVVKKCTRLQSQFSSLSSLKHSGISQLDLCKLILHLLRLVSATVTVQSPSSPESGSSTMKKATLHFENVGYIFNYTSEEDSNYAEAATTDDNDPSELEKELSWDFALPSPARETLLSMLITLTSHKGPLLSVSNSAIFPETSSNSDRILLILHWKSFLRMMLRTAPYLDEHKVGNPPTCSNSKQNTILRRTVHLVRHARHFFDQGIRPPCTQATTVTATTASTVRQDATARDIWEMVQNDLLLHTHTHACYRGLIFLYLFQPSRCTSAFYLEVLPKWMESWCNIDRCPEFDFLWLVLFCRARKYVTPKQYDWGPLRRRLLTQCQYWLQLPVGGGSGGDKFPRAGVPRSRSFPSRLKSFVGVGTSYEEGIDFVAKVSKLLVTGIGVGDPVKDAKSGKNGDTAATAGTTVPAYSRGTQDILRFLSYVTPYFNPSNVGSWTFTLGAFLHYFTYELCHRVGVAASLELLKDKNPAVAKELIRVEPSQDFAVIPPHEIVVFLDVLLPLCQQALYSKNGHVGRAGEASMVYLSQIDPIRVTPPFVDFATRALDYSAVNLAHQAPAALSAMTRVVQPALRRDPSMFLSRLPEILRLSLAGIDSNDQNKTIRTLIFYRNLSSWIPIGGRPEDWALVLPKEATTEAGITTKGGTIHIGENISEYLIRPTQSKEYADALKRLPESSLLYRETQDGDLPETSLLVEEAASALSDWSLAFLDRVYALLSASGEREKAGKFGSGVASRHSSADVQQARNFSRVMKECLVQVFSSMDAETHKLAVRSVAKFLEDETLPFASKDAAALCIAASGARVVEKDDGQKVSTSPGLDALVPILTDNLEHHSNKTLLYRLRCLTGAVRHAGRSVCEHRSYIERSLKFALASQDKHVFKTGCKLLRHTLASQCESYPLSVDSMPRSESSSAGNEMILGKSAHLREDPIQWHIPGGDQIEFAGDLLNEHVMKAIESKCTEGKAEGIEMIEAESSRNKGENADRQPTPQSSHQWRRTLRVIRYALRGGSGILIDANDTNDLQKDNGTDHDQTNFVPYERAVQNLLKQVSREKQESLILMKGRILAFTVCLLSVIASETTDVDAVAKSLVKSESSASDLGDDSTKPMLKNSELSLISSDIKVCKEVSDIALLLLTRRGANFRCQEAKTIWRAQKQLVTDYVLASQRDYTVAILLRSSLCMEHYRDNRIVRYKDGEDGGKTLPRRLVVHRVQLFYESIQRNASFEIPRRLRRQAKSNQSSSEKVFTSKTSMSVAMTKLESSLKSTPPRILDSYEGLIDGLFALSCHSNTQVRSSGFGVIDYALTRFGWIVPARVPRLLAAIQLDDEGMAGNFGIPSCAQLSKNVESPRVRKRLAEVIKGVCSIVSVSRAIKVMLDDESTRFNLAKTLCGTEGLISILPPEEIQKMVYYFHGIFSPFRSRLFALTRATEKEQATHEECLAFLMDQLTSDNVKVLAHNDSPSTDMSEAKQDNGMDEEAADATSVEVAASSLHWRNRLLVAWFLISFVDREDLLLDNPAISDRLWNTCFGLLEHEMGQPLQRVAVGLFGRLLSFALPLEARLSISLENSSFRQADAPSYVSNRKTVDLSILCEKLENEAFCKVLGKAIAFDHKEDTSVGGGHQAQWSAGVEEIFRDATSNVASRSLFPFQRTSRSSNTFKVSHAQMLESLLLLLGKGKAENPSKHFLDFAKEMASAPPSEDQRNQQCTSAEIFGGVCRALLQISIGSEQRAELWKSVLLPFLEDVIPKIPISLAGAYFDSLRFAIHFFPPSFFYELTAWVVEKIDTSLWQPKATSEGKSESSEELDESQIESSNGSVGTDGFTNQSKWLYLANAILVELDEETEVGVLCQLPWYSDKLAVSSTEPTERTSPVDDDMRKSWNLVSGRLLPLLLSALGHPYESCREHIAACLFRICYCHRKMVKTSIAIGRGATDSKSEVLENGETDPGTIVIKKLVSLEISSDLDTFKERYNSLITARKFVAYCLHLGDAKHEYSEYIIPLLPLAFEALEVTVEKEEIRGEEESKIKVAKRALEADVVKGFRHSIADMSSSAVIYYGKNEDISRVLNVVRKASKHEYWQVRHAAAHFLRCFQGYHKFLFDKEHAVLTTNTVAALLADERRDVSSAAMAALTGILAATPAKVVTDLVNKYVSMATRTKIKRRKTNSVVPTITDNAEEAKAKEDKERKRARNQQTSVFFLCATVLAMPYDTPAYVPAALAAISKHSFEKSAPLAIRDVVKKCCAEFKRTHMSDNWEVHRKQFTQEQLEALEDVVSAPHYYA